MLDRPNTQPSVLPLVAGLLLFATGWLSLAFPKVFAIPPYPTTIGGIAQMKVFFLSSGVFVFLAYAVKTRRDGWVPVALAAVGTVPYWVLSALALSTGTWIAMVVGATLGAAVLVDAVRPWWSETPPSRRIPTLAVAMAVIAAAIGILAFARPEILGVPRAALLRAYLRPLGAGMLASAILLGSGWVWPKVQPVAQVAGAVPFACLTIGFVLLGRWPGVLSYGLLTLALACESVIFRLIHRRATEREAQPTSVSQYEMATEAVAWGFTLLTVLVASITPDAGHRMTLAVTMVVTSLFTMTLYHLLPTAGAGLGRTVFASGVYSLMVAVLVQATGGVQSPYFFVTFLPILPLAWTHAPQTIIIPMAIPLGALIAGLGVEMVRGQVATVQAVTQGVPRVVGLLLVSGFTYLLAMRNLQSGNRIREAHRSLETVVTSMGEGLVATDESGRITLCNPAAATILGRSSDDLRGESLTGVLPLRRQDGTPVAQNAHPMWRALSGQQVPPGRFVIAGPAALPAAVAATPLAGTNGNHGAIILLRDARAEAEMERMREDFFFIASHELRTPLTVIKGNLEMAIEESLPPTLKTTIEEALLSTGRLIRMVNDFLEAARLDSGSVSMRIETGSLPSLVKQAVETMRPDAERKGLTITYHASADLPPVRMDAERVLQILINLLGNSVRYTQAGQIDVLHEVDGNEVETLVKDTGIGIAPEHHDRLFGRFGQVERGLRRGGGGSGLGLYISRRLAEQMGGTVLLKASVPGQGSTFALRLPVAAAEPVAAGR